MSQEFSTVVNQTHPGDSINGSSGNVPVNYSHFDRSLTAPNLHTVRFSDYNPFFHFNAIKKDKNFRYQSSKDLRTFTFKAPLMQKLKHHQQFFSVPYEAILPLQWERIFCNPVDGDDVPDDANTVIPEFGVKLKGFQTSWFAEIMAHIQSDGINNAGNLTQILKYCLTFEMFLSRGSLLNSLDYKISKLYNPSDGQPKTFDRWLQNIFDWFKKCSITFILDDSGVDYFFRPDYNDNDNNLSNDPTIVSFHRLLELCRDNLGTFSIQGLTLGDGASYDQLQAIFAPRNASPWTILPNRRPFNYALVCAYQIICAHFFTNDRVDYIYSADLYRQYIYNLLINEVALAGENTFFSYNGLNLPYDYLSGRYLSLLFDFSYNSITDISRLSALQALFSYKRSLRYVDYFTGAKTRPLAVGDVNVSVNQNLVNVVDVTRNIMKQKFLNAVNRFGRKFSNYLDGLFPGSSTAYDYHNPAYLMSIDSDVVTNEVENTGAAQLSEPNSVTAVLRSSGSQFVFDISLDRPSIVLGIEFFDIPRVYANNIDRSYFHVDRYDMFNPFMEYTGDQEVYKSEIDPSLETNVLGSFGYQTRYMEFKETVGTAHGGFYEYLPGYAFIADRQNGLPSPDHISPDYIRSSCVELDPFYVSLTGDTLANYFHFIIRQDNIVSIDRPMATAPSIL